MSKDTHYFRNKLNRAPATLDEMIEINNILPESEKWELLAVDESIFHMFRTNFSPQGEQNLKFVSYDGIYEGVYNNKKFLLTESNDVWNMGTYNYVKPSDWFGHGLQDVLPYDDRVGKLGNAEGAGFPTTLAKDNVTNYEQSIEAQKYRKSILLRWKGKGLE